MLLFIFFGGGVGVGEEWTVYCWQSESVEFSPHNIIGHFHDDDI